MPRGVYPRKKKDETGTVAASSTGASKTKRTWKSKGAAAQTSRVAAAGIQTQSFSDLTTYLKTLGEIRSQQTTPNAKLEQEFDSTIGNLRNMREQLFSVTTEEIINQQDNSTARQAAPVTAPVPFNPPAYSGQVQQ